MKTLIGTIIDKSGSMQSCVNDTIGGYNRFLAEQKALPDSAEVILVRTLFDTVVKTESPVALSAVTELSIENYKPDGSTALLDAIHRTVRELEKMATPGARMLVVILTDGEENSSREITLAAVKALIDEKTATGNWTFVYMGANVDAWAQAGKIGIAFSNTAQYAATPAGTNQAFLNVSAGATRLRSSGVGASATYFTSDEQDAK